MEKVTFLDSIVKILKTITSTPLLIGIMVVMIVLTIAISIFRFKNNKVGRIVTLCIYAATLIMLLVSHISFFINSIDKIIENFVKILYFPSWYIYLIALLYTDISLFIKLKNSDEEEAKKLDILEFVYFFVFQFLFFIIIHIVSKEDVDIFNSTELYNNSKLLSLIQVSSYIFWIRIFVKILGAIINRLSDTSPKVARVKKTKIKKKKEDLGGFDRLAQGMDVNTNNDISNNMSSMNNNMGNSLDNGINNDFYGGFYQEPDYSTKLNEMNDMYNNQNNNEFNNFEQEEKPKIYDIFNSPEIIRPNNTEDNNRNDKNNKKDNNEYGEFDIDDNSNYFDDFFE